MWDGFDRTSNVGQFVALKILLLLMWVDLERPLIEQQPAPCCRPTLLSYSHPGKSWSRVEGTATAGNRWWRCRMPSSPVLDRSYRQTVAAAHQTTSSPIRPGPDRFRRTPSVPVIQVYIQPDMLPAYDNETNEWQSSAHYRNTKDSILSDSAFVITA